MISWQKKKEEEKQKILNNQAFSWDQNVGEPNNAFSLFQLYLNEGRTRSFIKTQNLANSMDYSSILRLANCYQWKKRADEFDKTKDHEMMIELDAEILKNKLHQLNIGKKLQELAERGAEMLLENVEDLKAQDVAKLADTGNKLINLALGSATEIKDTKVEAEVKIKVEEIPKEIAAEIGKLIAIKSSEETKNK